MSSPYPVHPGRKASRSLDPRAGHVLGGVGGEAHHVIGLLTGDVGTVLLVLGGSSIANVLRHGAGQMAQMAGDREGRTTGMQAGTSPTAVPPSDM